MGCISSVNEETTTQPKENKEQYDDEEKEAQPISKTDGDDEIPTMAVNRMQSTGNPPQPSPHIQVTAPNDSDRRGGMTKEPSALNDFENNNEYNNTSSNHSPLANISQNQMVDSQGNVHVNRYYNQTRNANLSTTSKLTDMSDLRSINGGPGTTMPPPTYLNSNNLPIRNQGLSVVSATTTTTKILWDDFSERGSVMTESTLIV